MNKEIYEEIIRILLQYISGLEDDNWHLQRAQDKLIENQCKHNTSILDKPHSEVSKLRLFMETFKALSGEERNDVEKLYFIKALTNTEKFTEKEALEFIDKAMRNGQIYERKTGVYAKA